MNCYGKIVTSGELNVLCLRDTAAEGYTEFMGGGDHITQKHGTSTHDNDIINGVTVESEKITLTGDVSHMFHQCFNLKILDVSKFDVSGATNFYAMFCYCKSLQKIVGFENGDTSNVTDMSAMFLGCGVIKSIDGLNGNTSNVTKMTGMFSECAELETLDLSKFDTSKVTNIDLMFGIDVKLKSLNVFGWNTSSLRAMRQTFFKCYALTSLDLSTGDTSNVDGEGDSDGFDFTFEYCTSLEHIYVSDLGNIEKSTAYSYDVFYGDTKIHNWNGEYWIQKAIIDNGTNGGYLEYKAFSNLKLMVSDDGQYAKPYIKVSGVWKKATSYIKISGGGKK